MSITSDTSEEQTTTTDLIMHAHTVLYATDPVYKELVKARVNLTDGTIRPVSEWSFAEWENCLEEYQAMKGSYETASAH